MILKQMPEKTPRRTRDATKTRVVYRPMMLQAYWVVLSIEEGWDFWGITGFFGGFLEVLEEFQKLQRVRVGDFKGFCGRVHVKCLEASSAVPKVLKDI